MNRRDVKNAKNGWGKGQTLQPYDALALASLGALVASVLLPVLVGGKILLPLDTLLVMNPWRADAPTRFPTFQMPHNPLLDPVQQYYPWRDFATEWLRRGIVPLWNPYQFGGTPFVGNLLSAVLYPPNLLFLLTGPARGFGWSAFLHLWVMSAGMFLLLRGWDLSRLSSWLGGAALVLSGYLVAWLEFPNVSCWVTTWLPWCLWAVQAGGQRERQGREARWHWLGLVVLLACQFLGGHLQVSAHLVLAFLTFVAFSGHAGQDASVSRVKHLRRRAGHLVRWGLAPLVVASLLAAPQLLPAFELASLSQRRGATPYAEAVANALPWRHLPTFFVPDLYGNPTYRNLYVGHFNYIEMCGYAGVTTLLLAGVAMWRWRRRRVVVWVGSLTLAAMLLALGTPLYAALYYGVPGFSQLSAPGRFLWLVDFGLAALAACGLDAWRKAPPPSGRARAVYAGVWLALFVIALSVGWGRVIAHEIYPLLHPYLLSRIGLAALWLMLGLGLLLAGWHRPGWRNSSWGCALAALCIADLLAFGAGFNTKSPPDWLYFVTPPIEFLRQQNAHQREPLRIESVGTPGSPRRFLEWMAPNTGMVYRLAHLQGSDSLVLRSYWDLFGQPSPTLWFDRLHQGESAWLDLLHVRYLMSPVAVQAPGWQLVFQHRDLRLYRNEQAYPFAWWVARARYGTVEEVRRRALAEDWQPREEVWLVGAGSGEPKTGKGERPDRQLPSDWRVESFKPNRLRLRGAAPRDGWLVIGEAYAPGWRAVVDDESRPTMQANAFLRAAPLRAGEQSVTLIYAPTSFRLGGFLAGVGLALMSAAACCPPAGGRGSAPSSSCGERETAPVCQGPWIGV